MYWAPTMYRVSVRIVICTRWTSSVRKRDIDWVEQKRQLMEGDGLRVKQA